MAPRPGLAAQAAAATVVGASSAETPPDPTPGGARPEQVIAQTVKAALQGRTDAEVQGLMKEHLQSLRLMDAQGHWSDPRLAAVGDALLPPTAGVADLSALVDDMAANAEENPYLHAFLQAAGKEDLSALYDRVRQDGPRVFPRVAAYAMVLDRLTAAMRDDYRILEACHDIWKRERATADVDKHFGLFEKVKLASVEGPIERFIDAHKSGVVPADFMRVMLPLNIVEATVLDVTQGHWGNAETGWILATNRPGGKPDAATGSGPAHFSADGKAIDLAMPLPKEWADLYSTWNLAFVSHYRHFPYVMTKLLIPSVADYQDRPEEYIYNRALALYTHLNFAVLDGVRDPQLDWRDDHLMHAWGDSNQESAHLYQEQVKEARAHG